MDLRGGHAVGGVDAPESRFAALDVERRGVRAGHGPAGPARDEVAVEEPLEIRVGPAGAGPRGARSVSITMRTPGHDVELAVGFLRTEGLIRSRRDVASARSCGPAAGPLGVRNVVRVGLAEGVEVDLARLTRHVFASSSCGVCGKASLDAVRVAIEADPPREGPRLDPATIHALPARLRAAQEVFDRTGGLHAAALFDAGGALRLLREDVGRHNAVDKLVGRALLDDRLPLSDSIVCVSGRAGFELVQKALAAGAPVLAAVGAPSTLAVELARDHGMTLLGFVRDDRFNVYSGGWRVG